MSFPSQSFTNQHSAIQSLIAGNLQIKDLKDLRLASRDLEKLVENISLKSQLLQWVELFPEALRGKFSVNENFLNLLGIHTVDLSSEEEMAWKAAWKSLEILPEELSQENRMNLVKEYLPLIHEIFTKDVSDIPDQVPEVYPADILGFNERAFFEEREDILSQYVADGSEVKIAQIRALKDRSEYLSELYGYMQSFTDTSVLKNYEIDNIMPLALLESDFLTCLKLFTLESNRLFRKRIATWDNKKECTSLLVLAIRRLLGPIANTNNVEALDIMPSITKTDLSKSLLLCLLISKLGMPKLNDRERHFLTYGSIIKFKHDEDEKEEGSCGWIANRSTVMDYPAIIKIFSNLDVNFFIPKLSVNEDSLDGRIAMVFLSSFEDYVYNRGRSDILITSFSLMIDDAIIKNKVNDIFCIDFIILMNAAVKQINSRFSRGITVIIKILICICKHLNDRNIINYGFIKKLAYINV